MDVVRGLDRMRQKAELIVEDRKLQVSNLDKVLYPKAGFTKGRADRLLHPHRAGLACRI